MHLLQVKATASRQVMVHPVTMSSDEPTYHHPFVPDADGVYRMWFSVAVQVVDEIGVRVADGPEGFDSAGEFGMYDTAPGEAAYRLLASRLGVDAPGTEGLVRLVGMQGGGVMTYDPNTRVFRAMPTMSMPSAELINAVGIEEAGRIARSQDVEMLRQVYPELASPARGETPTMPQPPGEE